MKKIALFKENEELNLFIKEFQDNFKLGNKPNGPFYNANLTTEDEHQKVHMSGNEKLDIHFFEGLQILVGLNDTEDFNTHFYNICRENVVEMAFTIVTGIKSTPRVLHLKGSVFVKKKGLFMVTPNSVEFNKKKIL